jgi:hypothetical protein
MSILCSLIWIVPTTSSIISYTSDLVFSAAWFAAFGVLYRWYRQSLCGGPYDAYGYRCGIWKATIAFSFLAAAFWFASFLLGLLAVHRFQKKRGSATGSTT